jgi:hypothetical protein
MRKKIAATITMPCLFPFCNNQAVPVKIGRPRRIRGAKFMDYTAVCDCRARWSFTEEHFVRLDKAGVFKKK